MQAINNTESVIQSMFIVNSQINEVQNNSEMNNTQNLITSENQLTQNALESNTRFININRDLFTLIHELQYKVKKGTEELAKIISQNIEQLNVENTKLIDIQNQEKKENRIYFLEKDHKEQKISYQDKKQVLQMYLYNLKQSIKFDYEVILNQKQSQINQTQNLEKLENEQKSFISKRIISNSNQKQIESIFPSYVKIQNQEIEEKQEEEFQYFYNSKISNQDLNKINEEQYSQQQQSVIQQQQSNDNEMFQNEELIQQEQQIQIDNLVHSQHEEKFTKCFAFNENYSELYICQVEIIKCYKFNHGKIGGLIQELLGHKKQIKSLIYLKKTSQLVSGSIESKILVWQKNNHNQQWYVQQTLQYEYNPLRCLNGNENEDLLISGGNSKLNIWKLEQNKWTTDQNFRMQHVECIAINITGTKFVCIHRKSVMLIFERQKNKNWIQCQKINTQSKGTQICFISEDEFISHNKQLDYFNIFQQHDGKDFIKKQQSSVMKSSMFTKSTFQSKFIKEKKLFMIKHGQIIYIFNVKEDGKFEEKFSVRIIAGLIYGALTDDGQFLVTWNDKSKQLEVRKLEL